MSERSNTGRDARSWMIGSSGTRPASSPTLSITSAGKTLTAGQLTQIAQTKLTEWGADVWRQNNHATRGRKFIGRKGLPDIIGHASGGRAVYCEVKAEGDRLSDEQRTFLEEAHLRGCWAFICFQNGEAVRLTSWADYRMAETHDTA
jgi:hypothetical protein